MKRPYLTLVGFIIFSLGILSLILSLVGLNFTFLNFMYNHGVLTVICQLLMLFGGMVIMYVSRVSDETEES
ncbi:MAG: hypothetical protein IPG48_06150 [Saprospiraceae bacterium]|nr:hypothetical protein [Saprospiraceae bacterium]MBK7700861.1 hypothetical protein [Saprospiraceae bacterium]MBK8827858.1 hypothetical protein [Saprospiraceae bacterium]HMT54199.1 hypothetical protein [Saprospiraceae bacterium]HMT71320.1 hypothetical protein [Saprospiraceae bacterium]